MENITQEGSIVALIMSLTAVAGLYIQSKFLPLVSLCIGVLVTFATIGVTVEAFVSGLVFSLIASGLYDQKKILK